MDECDHWRYSTDSVDLTDEWRAHSCLHEDMEDIDGGHGRHGRMPLGTG